MGVRDVKGFIRLGGGGPSVLIKIQGEIKKGTLEELRAEIEGALVRCGVAVNTFEVSRVKSTKP